MLKRSLDIFLSATALILFSPILLTAILAIWLQDCRSPFYVSRRVGLGGNEFRMVKLRSMVINADRSGVDSTSAEDRRITRVGRFIRAYKLDELSQLCNVLLGHMSLVGPRPNVKRETDLYTEAEQSLLSVKPGLTDLASIVFADEGDILRGKADPDIAYNQLIRPWKSRLGLFYIDRASLDFDLAIIWLSALAIVARPAALAGVARILERFGADAELKRVARRNEPLVPTPPPGADQIVVQRSA